MFLFIFEAENIGQLAEDILDGLDDFDLIDFDADVVFEDIADILSSLSIPFTSCDP